MIRKYRFDNLARHINEDMAIFDSFFPTLTIQENIKAYNPETHDLVPKKAYKEEQLKLKEKELERLNSMRKQDIDAYYSKETSLLTEISILKQQLNISP